MGTDATLSIALIIAVIGCAITVTNFVAGQKKNTQGEDAKMEEIRTSCLKANLKLDTVCGTLTDIKTDVKAMQQKVSDTEKEIAVVKRDLKTAFNRIDDINERISGAGHQNVD